jgi:two-component system, sensor histidine kinase and response regulator
MLDRNGILARLTQAREDIDDVINAVLQGDRRRVSWTRLLAHNVNNHLVSLFFIIESFAELEDNQSPEHLAIYTNGLRELAERIQETIRRLMAVSHCDDVVKVADVELCGVVSEAVGRQSGYAHLKGIGIREQHSVTAPLMVKADRLALVEAVLNLIGNAIKYSPTGTTVSVSVSVEGGQAQCVVQDQGPGIRPEEQSRLFTLGGTLSSKPTAGEPQTGIGLALSFELVRAMGGMLWCDSQPGTGATFGIRLPLVTQGAGTEKTAAA